METALQLIVRVLFILVLGIAVGVFVHWKLHPYKRSWHKMPHAAYNQMVVYVDGKKYLPGFVHEECFLTHERRTGWTLWSFDTQEQIGSERNSKDFCITVDGKAVIGKLPKKVNKNE